MKDNPAPTTAPRRGVAAARHAVTSAGWAGLALVVGAAFLAVSVRWTEAVVVGAIGVVCLSVAVLSVVGRFGQQVEVTMPQARVRVGELALGEVTVRNGGRRSRATTLEFPMGEGVLPLVVPALSAQEDWSTTVVIPTACRGAITLGPARLVRSDALGLLSVVRSWGRSARLLIHPEMIRIPFDAAGFHADLEGVVTERLSNSDVAFHRLQEYAVGDDRRHVHWPTTARTGQLMVRHFEETRRSHHLIVLDTTAAWPADDFELAVSVAASLGMASVQQHRPVSLTGSAGWLPSASATRLLDGLTEIVPTPQGDQIDEVVRRATVARRNASVLSVVTSDAASDAAAARWSRFAGGSVVTQVVRVGAELPPARRRAAQATMLDCAVLSDLPRLLGRRR
ncbi:MAG: DUF58 domain-containing protein [Propioniciclava sp.]